MTTAERSPTPKEVRRIYSGFNCTVKGRSHELSGVECQDSSDYIIRDGYAVAVVADGHGGERHFRSKSGSLLAVSSVFEIINTCLGNPSFEKFLLSGDSDDILSRLEKQIILRWNSKVLSHLGQFPLTDREKSILGGEGADCLDPYSYYGTTLAVAVMMESCVFGFQIGDGTIVVSDTSGRISVAIEYDELAPANITSSMCSFNAFGKFRHFFSVGRDISSVFVSTDGLYTSFESDSDFLNYHSIIADGLCDVDLLERRVIRDFGRRVCAGSQDDTSLSCVFRADTETD